MAAVRLRLLPAYQLHERIWREDVAPALEALPERIAANRHFEFFWLPQKDRLELKALNPSTLPPGPVPDRRRERVGPAHEILPSLRDVPIVEMEYAVPAEHGVACFLELRERMRRRHPDVVWPVEYRTLAADEIPLSPAYGRETVTLSLHQGSGPSLSRVLRRLRGDLPAACRDGRTGESSTRCRAARAARAVSALGRLPRACGASSTRAVAS